MKQRNKHAEPLDGQYSMEDCEWVDDILIPARRKKSFKQYSQLTSRKKVIKFVSVTGQ